VGLHAADLMTDLKTGHMVGASPRQQLVAQLLGVIVGAVLVMPAFRLLVPDATALGGAQYPAPGAQVWASIGATLAHGASALSPIARAALCTGAVIGASLTLLSEWLPARARRWAPSPTGLGIALLIPAGNSFSLFLGSAAAALVRRGGGRRAAWVPPVAAGLIVGESVIGVITALAAASVR
jgi:uncharacterized oligopeptide transporter (OPT) family protein